MRHYDAMGVLVLYIKLHRVNQNVKLYNGYQKDKGTKLPN